MSKTETCKVGMVIHLGLQSPCCPDCDNHYIYTRKARGESEGIGHMHRICPICNKCYGCMSMDIMTGKIVDVHGLIGWKPGDIFEL